MFRGTYRATVVGHEGGVRVPFVVICRLTGVPGGTARVSGRDAAAAFE